MKLGKNANINFALEYTIKSSFLNHGQLCLCGSRIFIQKKIYNKFKKLLIKKASALKVGDPKEKNNFLGAVVSKNHMEKILKKIKTAKKEGGKVLLGGTRKFLKGDLKNGYYINPRIIENFYLLNQ